MKNKKAQFLWFIRIMIIVAILVFIRLIAVNMVHTMIETGDIEHETLYLTALNSVAYKGVINTVERPYTRRIDFTKFNSPHLEGVMRDSYSSTIRMKLTGKDISEEIFLGESTFGVWIELAQVEKAYTKKYTASSKFEPMNVVLADGTLVEARLETDIVTVENV